MIEYITDGDGDVIAFVDFWVQNQDGTLNDRGQYVYVNEMYVTPRLRSDKALISQFIDKIDKRVPTARYGWFVRRKYNNRPRIYPKRKWLKLMAKYQRGGKEKSNDVQLCMSNLR